MKHVRHLRLRLGANVSAYEVTFTVKSKVYDFLSHLPAIAIRQCTSSRDSVFSSHTRLCNTIRSFLRHDRSEQLSIWNSSIPPLPRYPNGLTSLYIRRFSTLRNPEWTDKRERMLVVQPRISPRWMLKSRLQEALRLAESLVSPPTDGSGLMAGKIGRRDGATSGPTMSPGVVGRDGGNPWLIVRGQWINRRSEGKGGIDEGWTVRSSEQRRGKYAGCSSQSSSGMPGWRQGSGGSSSQAGEAEAMVSNRLFFPSSWNNSNNSRVWLMLAIHLGFGSNRIAAFSCLSWFIFFRSPASALLHLLQRLVDHCCLP